MFVTSSKILLLATVVLKTFFEINCQPNGQVKLAQPSGSRRHNLIRSYPRPGSSESVRQFTKGCEQCVSLLQFSKQQLTQPESKQMIKKVVLDMGCAKQQKNMASMCSKFVGAYGDAYISLLAQRINPSEDCPKIGACGGLRMVDNVEEWGICPLCKVAIQLLDDTIVNKTAESIEVGLDNLCTILGTEMQKDCVSFVNTFYEDIVNAVMAYTTPEEVCSALQLCSNVSANSAVHHYPHCKCKCKCWDDD